MLALKKICNFICNNQNISNYLHSDTNFTRVNKLTFSAVVLKILHSFSDSVEYNLATFLPKLKLKQVTAGAFSIARYKIKIDFFKDLDTELCQIIESIQPKRWKGYRLIAGDGTSISIPVSKQTTSYFGIFAESKGGSKTVMANACMFYDVLSNFVLKSAISTTKDNEHTLMKEMLIDFASKDSILLLDRGFCYFYIYKTLIDNGFNFCIRQKIDHAQGSSKLIFSNNSSDFITEWMPSEAETATCKKYNVNSDPIKVRITKIILPSGEIEVLISNLFDFDLINKEDMKALYHYRWNIEEAFKQLKPKMKLEQFGSRKPEGIFQEFYAHLIMLNLTTLIAMEAEPIIEQKVLGRKLKYKYNRINAYKFIKETFIDLFYSIDIQNIIDELIQKISNSIISIRPNRSFTREHKFKRKPRFTPMYK